MRFLIAALVLTLAVAIAAATFAIWPVVADAPWEDKAVTQDTRDDIRCAAALSLRETLFSSAMPGIPAEQKELLKYRQEWWDRVRDEIDLYC